MAIHAHSTTAPIVQPRLLRGGGTVPCRALTTDELLNEIRLTIEGQLLAPCHATALASESASAEPLAAAESTASQPCGISDLAPREALASTALTALLPASASAARALHMRRELHQALDYGFTLLDALDLPPLALDVIDDAIATMDAMDAPDEDREEDDTAEAEPDDEEGGDLEAVDEDGDPLDLGERDGWRRPRRARVVDTEWPVAMAERERERAVVIAAVVTSPNVVRFPGSGPL